MEFWLTILGAILAIGGGFLAKAIERRQDRKSLRAALRAEIQAILAIVERREYLPGLSRFVEAIRVGSPISSRYGLERTTT